MFSLLFVAKPCSICGHSRMNPPMDFAVRLSVDSTKSVLVAANPGPYPGVWATVTCEDIRKEFKRCAPSTDEHTADKQGEITTNLLDLDTGAIGSSLTFIWDPKVDLNKLRANLSPILGCCDYSTVFLYNMMQSRVYRWNPRSWVSDAAVTSDARRRNHPSQSHQIHVGGGRHSCTEACH